MTLLLFLVVLLIVLIISTNWKVKPKKAKEIKREIDEVLGEAKMVEEMLKEETKKK